MIIREFKQRQLTKALSRARLTTAIADEFKQLVVVENFVLVTPKSMTTRNAA